MIDIVIVNWNAGHQLLDVLASIEAHHGDMVASVIVVDNASTDGSLDELEANPGNTSFRLKIVRNVDNRGFGAACNQGAMLATSEYLLFLNPDALLFENSIKKPVNFMSLPINREVGIVGVQLLDEDKHVARSCSRFPAVSIFLAQALGINRLSVFRHFTQAMAEWRHDSTQQVDQVIGAFFLMRRSIFESLHGFDERFFVYFEEVDLAFRARQAGYRSVYLADVQAFHSGGGTSHQVKAHRLFYSLRSRILYGFKHFNAIRAWALVFITLILEPITRSIFSLRRSGWTGVRNTLKGFGMLYADLPAIIARAGKS